jgi:hypothetical protein
MFGRLLTAIVTDVDLGESGSQQEKQTQAEHDGIDVCRALRRQREQAEPDLLTPRRARGSRPGQAGQQPAPAVFGYASGNRRSDQSLTRDINLSWFRPDHEAGNVFSTSAGDAPRSAARHWRRSVKSSISAAMSRSRSSPAAAAT